MAGGEAGVGQTGDLHLLFGPTLGQMYHQWSSDLRQVDQLWDIQDWLSDDKCKVDQ